MNDIERISVSEKGAELTSLMANGHEYLWQGDSSYWGRRAPVLFPIVGKLADDTLRVDGREYTMAQHGFARDAEFVSLHTTYQFGYMGFNLLPNSEPLFMKIIGNGQINNYPYLFDLRVRYAIIDNSVEVHWEVKNIGDKTMYFQIGAHPGFLLPDYKKSDDIHGYLRCYDHKGNKVIPISDSRLINGLRRETQRRVLSREDGLIPITEKTFKDDAFILDEGNIDSIGLLNLKKTEVLRVHCPQAQAFGLWAPSKAGCPFVCIEPWCGVADKEDYKGDISERDFVQSLDPDMTYSFDYSIIIKA